jgi:hypothetical protein
MYDLSGGPAAVVPPDAGQPASGVASDTERLRRSMDLHDWEGAARTVLPLLGTAEGTQGADLHCRSAIIAYNMHDREQAVREMRTAIDLLDASGFAIDERWCTDWLLLLDRLGALDLAQQFARDRAPSFSDKVWFQVATRRMDRGLEIRRALSQENRPIIALGHNCLCDDFGLRWGYAALTVDGPFSAAQFHGDGPAAALQTNFSLLRDPASVKVYATPSGLECPYVSAYGVVYCHETGPYWLADGLRNFFALYERRIQRFRNALARAPRPLFVFVQETPIDLNALVKGIETVTASDRWSLFLTSVNSSAPVATTADPRIRTLDMKLPSREYQAQWHLPVMYNSNEGFEFEQRFANAILEQLHRST